jgi:transketolase
MLLDETQLHADLFNTDELEHASTRDGFGEAIIEVGKSDERIVVLSADVADSVRASGFRDAFPRRYVEVGVAEQNMAGLAAGLASCGKIPFMVAYATFSPGRNWEQIRTTIALSELPVKIMGMHTGVSVGPDGATHQALEDITLMRVLPNMQIFVPADKLEAKKAVHHAVRNGAPTYIRFSRHETPVFTTEETPFTPGRAEYLWRDESPRVALMGAGPLLYDALLAARILREEGIGVSVLNLHSIKPMDVERVKEAARDAGAVVTIEEHQILGGVGGTVAEILTQNTPEPQEMVAVHDRFGQSGTATELLDAYHLNAYAIVEAARRVRARADGHA